MNEIQIVGGEEFLNAFDKALEDFCQEMLNYNKKEESMKNNKVKDQVVLSKKGIDARANGTFQAYVSMKVGNKTNKYVKAHIGTYPSLTEAYNARISFINNLK